MRRGGGGNVLFIVVKFMMCCLLLEEPVLLADMLRNLLSSIAEYGLEISEKKKIHLTVKLLYNEHHVTCLKAQ